MLEGADAASTLTGPALAGAVFSAVGAAWTLAVDAFSYFCSLFGIMLLSYEPDQKVKRAVHKSNIKEQYQSAMQGIEYLFQNRFQKFVTLNHAVLNFLTNAVVLLQIVLAKETLQLGVTHTGFLLAAAGLGNIVGVFLLDRIKNLPWGALFAGVLFVSSAGIALLAFSNSFCPGIYRHVFI